MVWRLFQCVVLMLGVLLAGCVSLEVPTKPQTVFKDVPTKIRQARLAAIWHWGINGSFSMQFPDKEPVIANYQWKQLGRNEYRINITSAFSIYNVSLVGRFGNVTMWDSQQEHYSAKSPEALMQANLGWSLPIDNLFYWIRGLPAPGKHKADYNQYGQLAELHQQGWSVNYLLYRTVDGIDLPEMIDLDRAGFHLRIVLKRWSLFMRNMTARELPDS